MKVRRPVVGLAAAVLLVFPGAGFAQDEAYVPPAEELTEARMIIDAMFPADKREQILIDMGTTMAGQAVSGLMAGPVFEEPGIRAIIEEFVVTDLPGTFKTLFAKHMPQIFEATAVAYTREFTLEELRDISAFARTPSGRRYFISLPKLQSDPLVAAATQAMFADLAPVQKTVGERVGKQVEEYLIANPEVLERLMKAGVGTPE